MKSNKKAFEKFKSYMKDDSANMASSIVAIVVFVIVMALGLVLTDGILNGTNVTSDSPVYDAYSNIGTQTNNIFGLSWNIPLVFIAATILGYLGYRLYQG
jgi:hypothetical protein